MQITNKYYTVVDDLFWPSFGSLAIVTVQLTIRNKWKELFPDYQDS